jgi:hypothetical protein
MDKGQSRYLSNRHVDGIMGETRKKTKKYDSDLSSRFITPEYLRRIFYQEIVRQAEKLILVKISGK